MCGAGPTGLGAAWRLEEHRQAGTTNAEWVVFESSEAAGGMARSEAVDGFVWDIGGHVLFPHFEYFDRVLDLVVDDWVGVVPVRGAWMWDRFIPYPVQRNLRHFPPEVLADVLAGLRDRTDTSSPETFENFLVAQFGSSLYETFMLPLNLKMWATHPSHMGYGWADQRSGSASANVPRVDLEEVLADIALERDAVAWSPDACVRYPARGGTGSIWSAIAGRLPAQRMRFRTTVQAVDTKSRRVTLGDGNEIGYDHLISSIPIDRFLGCLTDQPDLSAIAHRFKPAGVEVVGIGLSGRPPPGLTDVCSLYVPDLDLPFWRVTVLSNYSPWCVPVHAPHWSLLCEVNTGDAVSTPVDVVSAVLDGLVRLGFVTHPQIVSTWHRRLSHGYPVPHRDRDRHLELVAEVLEPLGVFCRGRFGGWRYEASNQDHAFMQGLEVIDRIIDGTPEVTYPTPARSNAGYDRSRRPIG